MAGWVQDFKASSGAVGERQVQLSCRQKALESLDFSLPISFFFGLFFTAAVERCQVRKLPLLAHCCYPKRMPCQHVPSWDPCLGLGKVKPTQSSELTQ